MNAENFSEFIKDSSNLFKIPYQELKTLVIQYPFCQNLRLLMVEKSRQEDHPDFHKNLEIAATYVPDRKVLLKRLLALIPAEEAAEENYQLTEDYLELKDLSELQTPIKEILPNPEEVATPPPSIAARETPPEPDLDLSAIDMLEDISPSAAPAPAPPEPFDLGHLSNDIQSWGTLHDQLDKEETETSDPATDPVLMPDSPGFSIDEPLIRGFGALHSNFELPLVESGLELELESEAEAGPVYELEAAEESSTVIEFEVNEKRPAPAPKSSFSSWLKQFQSPQVTLQLEDILEESAPKPEEKKPKKKKKNLPKELASQSVEENHEIATETLAALLEKQGHYKKAIAMYERLCVLMPEKQDLFTKKIEQMKS